MTRKPSALALGAVLALSPFAGVLGQSEGGPKVSTYAEDAGSKKDERATPKTHPRIDQELEKGGKGRSGKFWGEVHGWEAGDRRHGADLLSAFFDGPDAFRHAIFSGGLSPRQLRRLFARLSPYLQEIDPATGRRGRSFRGPPPDVWEELTGRFPRDPDGHAALGQARLESKDYARAAEAYDRALALGAVTAETLAGRGLAAQGVGDFQQANRDAAEALRLDPSSAGAAALLRLTQGRPSLATLRLLSGVNLATPPAAAASSAAAPVRPEPGAAPPLAGSGEQASAYWTREATRSLELGDLRAAVAAATRALAAYPGNVEALNLRATAKERAGDRTGAVQDAGQGLDLAPGNVALLNTRSWALSGLGRYEEALADSSRALGLAPESAFSRATMARAEGGLGRRAEMLDSLREAARLDRRFAPSLDAALSLPRDQDTEFLFQGGLFGRPPAKPVGRAGRFVFMLASTLVGGTLVALGLLHVLAPGLKERVTTALKRRPAQPEQGPSGTFWEHFTYKRVVASGGLGIVYEAVDKSLNRRVAVKQMRGEIRDDPKEREAFLKEARLTASLRHPGIVEAYSIVEDGPDLYLVFEYVEGSTLQSFIHDRGRLAVPEALALLKDICAAVQHAHDKGVIHRDLKPSNIMVTPAGRAKVMDFGLARQPLETRSAAVTATAAGTPSYMAPEAELGVLCKESDVFSLGICFYEMLTGRLPYEGMAGALALRKQAGKFEPASRRAPGIAAGIDAALARALAPQPKARPDSPGVLYAELARAAG